MGSGVTMTTGVSEPPHMTLLGPRVLVIAASGVMTFVWRASIPCEWS